MNRAPVLIANRGEIAIRVARTCKALGFPTVAVYSEADRGAEHIRVADQAVCIGGAAPKDSYLNVENLLKAARQTGAKFVHPGYGFLSERAHFVEACEKAGLVFVGPSATSMRQMGDKIEARKTVDSIGVPRVPGSAGAVRDAAEALEFGKKVGFPILLKAAAGGGGKGMRRVDKPEEVAGAFEGATRESLGAFGDGSLYVEKFILRPHHIEVQVFGDGKGGAIHVGERECSIQRRHQKVWEESPSPLMERFPKTREAMFAAALKITSHVKYAGAGTFEFIGDEEGNFYFLEMNTRLQVEHPVSEWVSGVDLVAWQLLLAAGELKLPAIPPRHGSAIEVRLYAEDPRTFLPAPGPIGSLRWPGGGFIRVDTSFTEAGEVMVHYDPMIAKVSVWGPTRADAIARLRVALDETQILPPIERTGARKGSLRTNLSFLRRLARHSKVIEGDTPTSLIADHPELVEVPSSSLSLEASLALAIAELAAPTAQAVSVPSAGSAWALQARREGLRT